MNTTTNITADNKLITFWKEQNDKADEIKLEEAALEIQIQAESYIHEYYKTLNCSKADLRKAKVDAQYDPDFENIVELSIEVKLNQKKLEEALEVYKEIFGENPKFEYKLS